MDYTLIILSAIVFLPAAGALFLLLPLWKYDDDAVRWFSLGICFIVFVMTLGFVFPIPGLEPIAFASGVGTMQRTFSVPWIPSFDIYYLMGIDGISMPLVLLTSFVSLLAMGASWSITKHVQAYCVLFLLLLTGMLGVFMALDFFLFYVFWEVMLLPMYFLIGVWGGPRKEYAAIKFFLYTLLGSVLMLVAILMLYFNSDIKQLVPVSDLSGGNSKVTWADLHLPKEVKAKLGVHDLEFEHRENSGIYISRTDSDSSPYHTLKLNFVKDGGTADKPISFDANKSEITYHLLAGGAKSSDVVVQLRKFSEDVNSPLKGLLAAGLSKGSTGDGLILPDDSVTLERPIDGPIHTFNLLALAALGQHTDVFSPSVQWWCFLLLFIGFIIKVPAVPVHTWLPDAHVEAPTPISMILAGVLLKMGGYGIVRICYPICPAGGYELSYFVCTLGVISMVYGAFAALAQRDFKRMVAYSSVSHMGYVLLGLGVWSANMGLFYDPRYWLMGVDGALFQMIGHGISSAGMFFCVGVLYDRVHHRNLDEFGGIFGKMPIYTAFAIGIFFAGLGLPGMCGFIGEVFVVLSVWRFSPVLAIIAASVVVLTAGYILWAIQRVYLGAEYKGPHEDHLHEMNFREFIIAAPLFVAAILFGVFPETFALQFMTPTAKRQVEQLADWTRRHDDEMKKPTAARATPAPAGTAPVVKASAAMQTPIAPPQVQMIETRKALEGGALNEKNLAPAHP